jgi:phosphatidylinositol glycan class M
MGKVLFVVCDMIAAVLIMSLLSLNWKEKRGIGLVEESTENRLVYIWLLNPFVFTISSRGSCESLIVMLVLLVLYLNRIQSFLLMTLVYSLVVHLKIYPIIFLLVLIRNIDSQSHSILTFKRALFLILFTFSTILINLYFYYLYD